MRGIVWFTAIFALIAILSAGCGTGLFTPIGPVQFTPSGPAQICSEKVQVSGEVYVDGEYVGYLHPGQCILAPNLTPRRWHTIELHYPGGMVQEWRFYYDIPGQITLVF